MSFKHIKVNRVIILDGASELSELNPAIQQGPFGALVVEAETHTHRFNGVSSPSHVAKQEVHKISLFRQRILFGKFMALRINWAGLHTQPTACLKE